MEIAKLALRSGERVSDEIVERPLFVLVSPTDDDSGIIARHGLIAEGTLTSIQEDEEEFDLVRHERGMSWLAPDNPFLDLPQKQGLDTRGLVSVGALLQEGDVLASALRTANPKKDRHTRPGKCWAVNDSWYAPPKWQGAGVTGVRILHRSELPREVDPAVYERVQIAIHSAHKLAAGDVLLCRRQPVGILSRFVDDEEMTRQGHRRVDLIFPRGMGARLGLRPGECQELLFGKTFELGLHAVQARAMEMYSLITKQPLLNTPCPGQVIHSNHIHWLHARGLFGNLAELTSLKSDDLASRSKLKQLLNSDCLTPESVPSPGAPESLLIMQTYLRMLSLDTILESGEHAVALTVRPASDEQILAWSSGQVRKPETIDNRYLEETETGLFCPKVFGSPANSRRRRFGHIVLPCPVVSFLWRTGRPSALESILDLPGETIENILRNKIWVLADEKGWQLLPAEKNREPEGEAFTGAPAVEAMLKASPAGKLSQGVNGRPIQFVQRIVPVGPPEIRPLVLLDNGNWATADVNDLYRRLINRANRLAKLDDLKAPPVIIHNERRELQICFDQLQANCLLPALDAVVTEGGSEARLVDCLKLVEDQFSKDNKRVEWSGKARAVASARVPENHVRVPLKIFDTLRLDPQAPVLLTSVDGNSGAFVSLLPQPHDHAVIELPARAYSQLELTGAAPLTVIHRPLGSVACSEAKLLLQGEIEAAHQIPKPTERWVDAVDLNEFVYKLAQAALQGSATVLESPRALLPAGTGSTLFTEDQNHPSPAENALEVTLPAPQETLEGRPLRVRMREVLQSARRKACIFHLTPAGEDLAIGEPRVGGLPDLPDNFDWPRNRDGQLAFLGQLPLDPAREAGILPIEVPAGSALCVFSVWASDQACSSPGPVFVCPPGEKLRRGVADDKTAVLPRYRVQPEIVDEYPNWEELVEIFTSEIGAIDRKDLTAFRKSEWEGLPHPHERVKIGGWPAWVQAPAHQGPLLAQFAADDSSEISFDEGTLYVFVSPLGSFEIHMQFT
jgi:hypothetical protein